MSVPSLPPKPATPPPSTSTATTTAPAKTTDAPAPAPAPGKAPPAAKLPTPAGGPDTYVTFGKSDDVAKALGLIGATDRAYCTAKGTRIDDASGQPKAEVIEADSVKLRDLLQKYDAPAKAAIQSMR